MVLSQELLRLILLRLLRLDQSMDAWLSHCNGVSAAKQVVKLWLQAELLCVGVSVKRTHLNHWVSSLQQLILKQVLLKIVRVIVVLLPVWVHDLSILDTMEVDQFAVADFLHKAVPIEVICAMKVDAWEVVQLLHVDVWFMTYHWTHKLLIRPDALYRIARHNGQALLGVLNVLIIGRCFVLSKCLKLTLFTISFRGWLWGFLIVCNRNDYCGLIVNYTTCSCHRFVINKLTWQKLWVFCILVAKHLLELVIEVNNRISLTLVLVDNQDIGLAQKTFSGRRKPSIFWQFDVRLGNNCAVVGFSLSWCCVLLSFCWNCLS